MRPGEIFGLLGPNGAGKTTTAGMLTTRVIPTSGQAYVGGIDVVAPPLGRQAAAGGRLAAEHPRPALNVWENLYFHGRLFGMPAKHCREIADELLEKFHLTKWAKASVYALSGGMAQRLMVARSIFHRPAVLFLDEPTAGLDPQSRLALWEILQELNAEGQTILLTTHYMEEADQLCDRVAIMDHGRILALDTPRALKQHGGRRHDRHGQSRRVTSTASQQLIEARDRRGDQHPVSRRRRGGPRAGAPTSCCPRSSASPSSSGSESPTSRCRAHAGDRLHQPDREGPARLMADHDEPRASAERPRERRATPMTTSSPTSGPPGRPSRQAARRLAARAISPCLRKNIAEFVIRTLVQPFLLVFVFLYVFPTIGQGIGSRRGPGGRIGFRHHPGAPACRHHHHVPGHPGRGHAAVDRVRLHPRDRRPGAGPVPGMAGRRWPRCSRARSRACSPP